MSGVQKPKSYIKDTKHKNGRGDWNADEQKKQRSKRDAGARVHEKSLEKRESVTYSSVVVAV